MLSPVFTFRILASLRCARCLSPRHLRTWGLGRQDGTVGALAAPAGRAAGRDRHQQGDRCARPTRAAAGPETADRRDNAAEGATMAKATDTRSASTAKAATKRTRSAAETEKIRVALVERRDELQTEYDQTLSEITELQRDRLTDSAGDDQADTGTKTLEREQEITLANNLLDRITQVERAIDRLGEGNYGWCEKCGNAIPVERLAAFPSATLCVSCKQLEERR
jgi:DnaK suppressor protein